MMNHRNKRCIALNIGKKVNNKWSLLLLHLIIQPNQKCIEMNSRKSDNCDCDISCHIHVMSSPFKFFVSIKFLYFVLKKKVQNLFKCYVYLLLLKISHLQLLYLHMTIFNRVDPNYFLSFMLFLILHNFNGILETKISGVFIEIFETTKAYEDMRKWTP